jgi:hypothetical protein
MALRSCYEDGFTQVRIAGADCVRRNRNGAEIVGVFDPRG